MSATFYQCLSQRQSKAAGASCNDEDAAIELQVSSSAVFPGSIEVMASTSKSRRCCRGTTWSGSGNLCAMADGDGLGALDEVNLNPDDRNGEANRQGCRARKVGNLVLTCAYIGRILPCTRIQAQYWMNVRYTKASSCDRTNGVEGVRSWPSWHIPVCDERTCSVSRDISCRSVTRESVRYIVVADH